MAVKLQPTSVIKAHLGIEPNGRVEKFFTQTVAKAMDKYVPKDEGNLRKYKIEGNSIIYDQLYAEIQYYGIINGKKIPESHYTTPGTGPYWDKKMWSAESERIVRQVQNYVDRGAR